MDAGSVIAEAEASFPAHELTRSFDCRTPGCDGEAKAKSGRFAYCVSCQVRRGTALPDGTPIIGRPIPNAPGSRVGGKRPKRPPRAREGGHPTPKARTTGLYEARASVLLRAARELDQALEAYRAAKPALEEAVRGYRSAVKAVVAAGRSNTPEAAESPEANGAVDDAWREQVRQLAEDSGDDDLRPRRVAVDLAAHLHREARAFRCRGRVPCDRVPRPPPCS